jgi:hypothetical protein
MRSMLAKLDFILSPSAPAYLSAESPGCEPSRAELLSGTIRHGVNGNWRAEIDE